MQINRSQKYRLELQVILRFITKDKFDASKKFKSELDDKIDNLIFNPYQHRKSYYYDDENIRDMIYKGYTVIYKITEDSINIASIFNQNLPNLNDNSL